MEIVNKIITMLKIYNNNFSISHSIFHITIFIYLIPFIYFGSFNSILTFIFTFFISITFLLIINVFEDTSEFKIRNKHHIKGKCKIVAFYALYYLSLFTTNYIIIYAVNELLTK
jgi:hypothetical protein